MIPTQVAYFDLFSASKSALMTSVENAAGSKKTRNGGEP